jgi:glycosyltransferase involved in cell wall biosynthesis
MKIAFVHGHLELGGIETLLLRLVREMSQQGHEITIVAGPRGNHGLETMLAQHAHLQRVPVSLARGYLLTRRLELQGTDVFFACGASQLLFAETLRERFAPSARLLAGVYIPWEYRGGFSQRRYDWALGERLFAALPDENIVFMNENCRAEHGAMLRRDFRGSPVIPLPVDVPPTNADRRVDRNKIVTIGRIVYFKPTTFHMLDALAELRRSGRRFRYEVYGDGAGLGDLQRAVREKQLSDSVTLHGSIEYTRIPSVLADAFLFVGVATAALEAAALGVPTLMGVESHDPVTLGFLHETREGEVGEGSSLGDRYSLVEKIRWLDGLSDAEYREVSARDRNRAARYGSNIIAAEYLAAFKGAKRIDFSIGTLDYARTLASILRWSVKGWFGHPHPDADRWYRRAQAPQRDASAA